MFGFGKKKPTPKQKPKRQLVQNARTKQDLESIRNSSAPVLSFGFGYGGVAGNINSIINQTLPALVAKSRELSLNNPIAKKYVTVNSDGVTGASGLYLKPNANIFDSIPENEEINKKLEVLFYRWAEDPELFSMNGKLDWSQWQRLLERTRSIDGECFCRIHDNGTRIKIEIIDSMRIPTMGLNKINDDGTYISNGIHFDQYGKPLNYYVMRFNPSHYTYCTNDYEIVPANEMMHYFVSDYPDQQRGVPDIIAGMGLLQELSGFVQASIVSKKLAASAMGFITNTDKSDADVDFINTDDTQYYENDYLEGGALVELQPGQSIQQISPSGAIDSITEFIDAQMTQIAMSLNVTEINLTGDTKSASFSASKLADRMQQQTFKSRINALSTICLKPLYKRWLKNELLNNEELEYLPFSDFNKIVDAKYIQEQNVSLDPLKDVQTQKLMVESGFKSRAMIISEMGYDPYSVLREIQEERETYNLNQEEQGNEEESEKDNKPTED